MTGGKREGAGRPRSPDPANILVTIKLTQSQHKLWKKVGAGPWVKSLLNELNGGDLCLPSTQSESSMKKSTAT
jgi:hypothetical protein